MKHLENFNSFSTNEKKGYAQLPGGGMDEEAGKRHQEEMKDPKKKKKWLAELNKKPKGKQQKDKRVKG